MAGLVKAGGLEAATKLPSLKQAEAIAKNRAQFVLTRKKLLYVVETIRPGDVAAPLIINQATSLHQLRQVAKGLRVQVELAMGGVQC